MRPISRNTFIAALAVIIMSVGCKSDPEETSASQTAGAAVPSIQAAPGHNDEASTDEAADETVSGESVVLELPNQSRPLEGVTAAGQPTLEQFEQLREAGYHTVINLRTESEPSPVDEKRKSIQEKLVYKQIPISGPDDLTKENVKKIHEELEAAGERGDVLIHCGSSNRVGAVLALRAAWHQGKTPEEALELGRKAGLQPALEPAVKAKLGLD